MLFGKQNTEELTIVQIIFPFPMELLGPIVVSLQMEFCSYIR